MTASLLAIDPGVTAGCACAAFAETRLVCVWFERIGNAMQTSKHVSLAFDTVLVERPAYQGARTLAARDQDLMALAWEGALLAGSYAGRDNAVIVEWAANDTSGGVRGWKGSEPKAMQHVRLWERLAEDERALLGGERTKHIIYAAREKGAESRWPAGKTFYSKAFITHNLLDAVALGCTYLGRLERTA